MTPSSVESCTGQEAWLGRSSMAWSASLAASHTAQRSAGGSRSSAPQTARTSPDENHNPHPAVLLRARRVGGGTGLRCHSWPSVQPPRRTHSRAAAILFPSCLLAFRPSGSTCIDDRDSRPKGGRCRRRSIYVGHPSTDHHPPPVGTCREATGMPTPGGRGASPGVGATRRVQRLGPWVGHRSAGRGRQRTGRAD